MVELLLRDHRCSDTIKLNRVDFKMGTKYGGNYERSLGLVRNAEERGNLHIRVCKRI